MGNKIKLYHGDGGVHTNRLIKDVFYKHFSNDLLLKSLDSAVIELKNNRIAFTTDSFVVKPLFFSGGDIGKLAVYGTVNDLSVQGARPLYLSCSFIIEEGFDIDILNNIVKSMAEACSNAGVKIVTGDTKVVEKGSCDGVFINTSGIGIIENGYVEKEIEVGDRIIITGTIAEHGSAIAIERYGLGIKGDLASDCSPVNRIVQGIGDYFDAVKIMKDPTRGGLATSLNEISKAFGVSIEIEEESIPLRNQVKSVCNLLGIDPLYLASEGRIILIVNKDKAQTILERIKNFDECREASIIGTVTKDTEGMVYIKTDIGGRRILNPLAGGVFPRIC